MNYGRKKILLLFNKNKKVAIPPVYNIYDVTHLGINVTHSGIQVTHILPLEPSIALTLETI